MPWPQPVIFPSDSERLTLVSEYKRKLAVSDAHTADHMANQPNRYIDPDVFDTICALTRAHFNSPQMQIVLVGSASLGFSPIAKPSQNKLAWRAFSDASDIDLAIIDQETFDRIWLAAYRHKLRSGPWDNMGSMAEYFFAGWFRPDLAPTSFALRNDWFDFFRKLSANQLELSVTAGLYRSQEFLHEYRLKTCRAARQN